MVRRADMAGAAKVPAGMLSRGPGCHRTDENERTEYCPRNPAKSRTTNGEVLHDSLPGSIRINAARSKRTLSTILSQIGGKGSDFSRDFRFDFLAKR
jgi:hypothetical protein